MFNRPLFVCAFALLAPSMTLAETETCQKVAGKDIAALFVRWNDALQSGNPQNVVDTYAQDSLLLPTLSNTPRRSADAKADYFRHFMAGQPRGNIDSRMIQIDCNTALDAGLYTFRFADGKKGAGALHLHLQVVSRAGAMADHQSPFLGHARAAEDARVKLSFAGAVADTAPRPHHRRLR